MKLFKGKYFIITGTVLLIAALFLVFYNLNEDKKSGEYAESVLAELKIDISRAAEETTEAENDFVQEITEDIFSKYETEKEETSEEVEEIPESVEINGEKYIGIISIPSIGIELPVMAEWSYPNLKHAPCRYKGNAKNSNLIICAHNYNSHFGGIRNLNTGELISFTDCVGSVYSYEVVQIDEINGKDVEAMMKNADNEWDLTIFTCTLSGQSRVTVRAQIVEETE